MATKIRINYINKKENVLKEMFGRAKTTGKLKESTLKELRKELKTP